VLQLAIESSDVIFYFGGTDTIVEGLFYFRNLIYHGNAWPQTFNTNG